MNMASNPMAPIMASLNCSWNASMSTTTKPVVESTSLALFWSIWSQEPWIRFVRDHLVNSSDLTTLSLDNLVPVIIGLKATTPKVLS